MKLHLGCGRHIWPGFTNCDFPSNHSGLKPDMECDLTQRLPFADDSADEIHAIHVFEHFYRYEADAILADWVRVLKPGGTLVLELPCLDKIIAIFNHHISQGKAVPENLTLWGLYGDPVYRTPEMVHRWCYSVSELSTMMEITGLRVSVEKAKTHQPIRDMRVIGLK